MQAAHIDMENSASLTPFEVLKSGAGFFPWRGSNILKGNPRRFPEKNADLQAWAVESKFFLSKNGG